MKHICQGTRCHTYDTQSRIRGVKGSKVLRTRNARYDNVLQKKHEWLNNWEYFFCDERCMNNWLDVHMTQLISFVGRLLLHLLLQFLHVQQCRMHGGTFSNGGERWRPTRAYSTLSLLRLGRAPSKFVLR